MLSPAAVIEASGLSKSNYLVGARTDDPRRRQIKKAKFGGLQKLRAGYMDGWLSIDDEVMKKYMGDFDFDTDDYLE